MTLGLSCIILDLGNTIYHRFPIPPLGLVSKYMYSIPKQKIMCWLEISTKLNLSENVFNPRKYVSL